MFVVTPLNITTAHNKYLYLRGKNLYSNKGIDDCECHISGYLCGGKRVMIGKEKARDVDTCGVLARLYFLTVLVVMWVFAK